MDNPKANSVWQLLLPLIFLRPFICQMCYPRLDVYYGIVFLLSCLLWLIFQKKLSFKSCFNYPILFLLIALCLSTLFSINLRSSLKQIYKFITYLAVFYLMGQITPKQKKQILITLLSAACLLSLYGIYQFFRGFQHILDYLSQIEPYPYAQEFLARKRVFATFFSPDMFAGYLIMIIPLAVGLLLETVNKHQFLSLRENDSSSSSLRGAQRRSNLIFCLLTGLSIIFMFISLLLTKSIGAWISLLAAFLVFSALLFVFYPLLRRKIIFSTIITSIIIIPMLTGIFIIRADYFFDFNNPHNSIVQRLYFWKSAIKIIKDYPLTGIGLGNFGLIYPQYKIPQAFQTNFAHNSYLQIWAEMGLLGILAWLWLIVRSFQVGLRKLKALEGQTYLVIGLLAASSGFLIHNLIDFSFFLPEVAFNWWVILGLIYLRKK